MAWFVHTLRDADEDDLFLEWHAARIPAAWANVAASVLMEGRQRMGEADAGPANQERGPSLSVNEMRASYRF